MKKAYGRSAARWRRGLKILDSWPFFVWLGACIACVWLYYENPRPQSAAYIRGLVDAADVSLAAVETARIQKIHVKEGQEVRVGDLLVEMDTSLIAHGVTADGLDAIRIETAFGDTHQDVLQAVSQRQDAIASIEAEIAACRQEQARESAQLESLQKEQKRRQELHADRLIDDLTRLELLPDIAALEKAVALYPSRLAMYEKQLAAAQTYHRNILKWLGAEEGGSVSDAIRRRLDEEQVQRLIRQAKEEAELHRKAYQIRASRSGVVSQIFCREGEVVSADMPILRLVDHSPERIIAYLEEAQVAQIRVGQELYVQSMYRPTPATVVATVESVSAEVNSPIFVLSPTGRQNPLRAQRAILRIQAPHSFVGGEAVVIRAPWTGFMGLLERVLGGRRPAISVAGEVSS